MWLWAAGHHWAQQALWLPGQQGNIFIAVNLSRVRASYIVSGDSSGSGLVYEIALKIRPFLSSGKILLRTVALWVLMFRYCPGPPLLPSLMLVATLTIFPLKLPVLPMRKACECPCFTL